MRAMEPRRFGQLKQREALEKFEELAGDDALYSKIKDHKSNIKRFIESLKKDKETKND